MFLISAPDLRGRAARKAGSAERALARRAAVLKTAAGMPHQADMAGQPGYVNRLLTVRHDLAAGLCQVSNWGDLAQLTA